MTQQPDWLGNGTTRPKCATCSTQMVAVQRARYDYVALHSTPAGQLCKAEVVFAAKLQGGEQPLVDPCPGCGGARAKFLSQGSTEIWEAACPKGCS